MIGTVLATTVEQACGTEPGFLCELIFDTTGSETFADVADFLVRPAKVVLILLVAWIVKRFVGARHRQRDRRLRRVADQEAGRVAGDRRQGRQAAAVSRRYRPWPCAGRSDRRFRSSGRSNAPQTLGAVLRSIASVTIYFIAVVMVLGEFNVNLGPLIAGAGIIGVALGFGAQSLVKDFLSGIFMLLEDQYGVGDVVNLGDASGTVGMQSTCARPRSAIPVEPCGMSTNGEIRRVGNMSQQWARAVLDLEVALRHRPQPCDDRDQGGGRRPLGGGATTRHRARGAAGSTACRHSVPTRSR